MTGPYDSKAAVEADLRKALEAVGGDYDDPDAHVRLFTATLLDQDVQAGAHDLMTIRYLAVVDPTMLYAARGWLVRSFDKGYDLGQQAAQNRSTGITGEALH